MERQIRVK
jgi:hypothetical protein